jgi:hypothetical protein
MSKAPDTAQLSRKQKLASLPDGQIDTSDIPVIADGNDGVRGGSRIDLYKRNSFLLDAKQSHQKGGARQVPGRPDCLLARSRHAAAPAPPAEPGMC